MLLQFKRTLVFAVKNILHNKWLVASVVGVIAVALFVINIQVANIVANDLLLKDIQSKINVSVHLKEGVQKDKIIELKKEIEGIEGVKKVVHISKEETLDKFKKSYSGNEVMEEALTILEDNPFEEILNIQAVNSDDYKQIVKKIKTSDYAKYINNVSYENHKEVIDGMSKEIKSSQKTAFVFGVTLSVVAIMVTFNTIMITIYTHRKEIEIMKLVGASNFYTAMPFVWEGIFYGLVGAILAIISSYFYLYFITSGDSGDTILFLSNVKFIKQFLGDYFVQNIFLAIGFQLLLGVLLGVISSMVAIKKYLKV